MGLFFKIKFFIITCFEFLSLYIGGLFSKKESILMKKFGQEPVHLIDHLAKQVREEVNAKLTSVTRGK